MAISMDTSLRRVVEPRLSLPQNALPIFNSQAMTSLKKTALVPYSPVQMYELVNDVESYAQFLPWCTAVTLHNRTDESLEATIKLKNYQSFTTHNSMEPGNRIDMKLVEGPFKYLTGTWLFEPLGPNGCHVTLEMNFELAAGLLGMAFGKVFNPLANSMVDAFSKEAARRYGGK
jgi:ribosome-associated toxin RatA of RatAB toxin-antitoxin module